MLLPLLVHLLLSLLGISILLLLLLHQCHLFFFFFSCFSFFFFFSLITFTFLFLFFLLFFLFKPCLPVIQLQFNFTHHLLVHLVAWRQLQCCHHFSQNWLSWMSVDLGAHGLDLLQSDNQHHGSLVS